jgi:hypothetical protein
MLQWIPVIPITVVYSCHRSYTLGSPGTTIVIVSQAALVEFSGYVLRANTAALALTSCPRAANPYE